LSNNLPWLATLILLLLSLSKVFIVSDLNTTTALTLLSKSNPLSLMLGAFLSVLPSAALLALNVLSFMYVQTTLSPSDHLITAALMIPVAIISASLSPWWVSLIILFLLDSTFRGPLSRFIDRRRRATPPPRLTVLIQQRLDEVRAALASDDLERAKELLQVVDSLANNAEQHIKSQRRVVMMVLAFSGISIIFLMLSTQPWLPAERIVIGKRVVTGYVVTEGADSLLVLTASNRAVQRIATTSIVSRTYCTFSGATAHGSTAVLLEVIGTSPLGVFMHSRSYPDCNASS
jgi:hypothetical protein